MKFTEQELHTLLQGISVAPQPQILVDLQMAQAMGDDDAQSLYQLIGQDIGLSGSILKLHNRLADTPTANIPLAIASIGASNILQVANGLSIKGELNDHDIGLLNPFWDSSHDIATVCQLVAEDLQLEDDCSQFYSLGLLHNAGMALMLKKHPDYFSTLKQSYQGEQQRIIDLENTRYQTNHAVLGYYCARAWRLPAITCEVIAEHHSAHFALEHWPEDHPGRNLIAVLKVAEYLCNTHRIFGQQRNHYEWLDVKEAVFLQLDIGDYEIEAWHDRFRDLGINSISMA